MGVKTHTLSAFEKRLAKYFQSIVLPSDKVSGSKFGTARANRLSTVNDNFTTSIGLFTHGEGKKGKTNNNGNNKKARDGKRGEDLTRKTDPEGTGVPARLQAGFNPRRCRPGRQGSGSGTPAPPDRCSDPRGRAALRSPPRPGPAGHFQPGQPAAPRGGGASAALGGAAAPRRAGNEGLTAAGAGRGAEPNGLRGRRPPPPTPATTTIGRPAHAGRAAPLPCGAG